MTPQLMLLSLGGAAAIFVGFTWSLYRLGGFVPSEHERRGWRIAAVIVLLWAVLLAFIGPLPTPILMAMNLGVLAVYLWAWRSGRLRLVRVPVDARDEVEHRRQWMRQHIRLVIALGVVAIIAITAWSLIVVLVVAR